VVTRLLVRGAKDHTCQEGVGGHRASSRKEKTREVTVTIEEALLSKGKMGSGMTDPVS